MIKVGITGHRPEQISDPQWVKDALCTAYEITTPSVIYQGMAAGVDLWSAKQAWSNHIPYVCVRPWAGHKARLSDRIEYDKTIKHSLRVVDVSPLIEYPGPWIYSKRNEWIVDTVDIIIAVWNGTSGGTSHCVEYASDNNTPILQINPKDRSIKWLNFTPQEHSSERDSW
jgi:uncharacterized phage-like protein YoqJ